MGRTARWGHIRRRQSGRYAAEYQDPTTPHPRARIRAPYTFRTKAAAEAWLAAERALIETGSWQHLSVREAERAEEARRAHDSATLTFLLGLVLLPFDLGGHIVRPVICYCP